MTRRLQCSHVKPGGAQCGRSAGEGGACRVHTAGYVAKARKPRAKPLRDLGVTAPPSSIEEAARAMGVARAYAECEREPWRDAAVRESVVRAAGALVALDDVPAVVAPCREAAGEAALVLAERGVSLYRAEHLALLEVARAAGGVDALIVDAPYSERTHAGHDDGTETANSASLRVAAGGASATFERRVSKMARRGIDYAAWSDDDVRAFVDAWAPLCRGWLVSLTDHVLADAWASSMEAAGRYAFAPIACTSYGSRFRATGDGPSQWSCWAIVSRPKSNGWLKPWRASRAAANESCSLPGAYSVAVERMEVVGGKQLGLMRALVRDYTRRGDLVCDPCAGAGTLGVACIAEGRRALLGDRDAAHVEIARKRLLSCPGEQRRLMLDCAPVRMEQTGFGKEEKSDATG